MKSEAIENVKEATKRRASSQRKDSIGRFAAEAGIGAMLFGIGAIVLFIISVMPTIRVDDFSSSGFRCAGLIALAGALAMYFVHRAVDV